MKTRTGKIIMTVDVVAVFGRQLVMLIKRKHEPFRDKLVLPGGHVDPGETCVEAAVRELREETDISVRGADLRLLTILDDPKRDPRPDGRRVSVVYVTEVGSGRSTPGDDALEALWCDLVTLKAEDVGFDHWRAIEMVHRQLAAEFARPMPPNATPKKKP